MIPWKFLAETTISEDSNRLRLYQRGTEFSIRVENAELMNSRQHASEDALSTLAFERMENPEDGHILIGGLGMGFTLAAALKAAGSAARITLFELVPAVVEWNRGPLGHLAGNPLEDPRCTVRIGDVGSGIAGYDNALDAILLDVDNGPDGLTQDSNDWLYGFSGLQMARKALRTGGILGVWSVAEDPAFTRRMKKSGFEVEEVRVRARGKSGGRHTIWLGKKI